MDQQGRRDTAGNRTPSCRDQHRGPHGFPGRGGKMRSSWSATLSLAGCFVLILGRALAGAQGTAQPAGDQDFVARAAMSNMVAIQLGHLATKKAHNADVKQFAQTTIDEHLKVQQQLADAAYGAGVRWPKKLDENYRRIQQRLSKLSNDQFDREFMKVMIDRD